MIRNEYRRAFIMLRAVMPGYGGHVRLERRTLTGSMYFIITAPQGVSELAAALVGCQNGEYCAAPIGPLSRDRRGQLALAWQFDPRNIDGRPLEAYPWVAVVATGGPCALALTGNVEGSRTVDAHALERVACGLFTPASVTGETPASDLPEPKTEPVATADDGQTRGDVRIYTMTRARLRHKAAGEAQPAPPPAEALPATEPLPPTVAMPATEALPPAETLPPAEALPPTVAMPAAEALPPTPQDAAPPRSDAGPTSSVEAPDAPSDSNPEGENPQPASPTPSEPGEKCACPQPAPITAAQQLGLDITVPWPGIAESLRRLFATQSPADRAPEDGFTYVRAPMPGGSGYRESYAGLKVEEGRITNIRYALPGHATPEPPPGLEAAHWLPGEGADGFWVTEEGAL